MLTSGGIDNQPAGRWLALVRAGSLVQFMDKMNSSSFDWGKMTEAETKEKEKIDAVEVDRTPLSKLERRNRR